MKAQKPADIDAYLATISADKRAALTKLRAAIHAAAPDAEECISYGIPAIRWNGRVLVYFAAATNHCSFFPGAHPIATFADALADYDTSKGTVRFGAGEPLPATLVRKLVKARMEQITRKLATSKGSKAAKAGKTPKAENPATSSKAAKPSRPAPSTGYSGTPLAKKLGISAGTRVALRHAPGGFDRLLEPLPESVVFATRVTARTDIVHLFCDRRATLGAELRTLRTAIRPDAAVWVSWPKKSAKVPTDVTEDTIRALALPLGFVDVKVCAVNDVWSGLKLVVRTTER